MHVGPIRAALVAVALGLVAGSGAGRAAGQDPEYSEAFRRGQAAMAAERYAEAAEHFEEAIRRADGLPNADEGATWAAVYLANARRNERNIAATANAWKRAYEAATRAYGADDPLTLRALASLGQLEVYLCKFEGGERRLRDALRRSEAQLGPKHPFTAMVHFCIGAAHDERAEFSAAEREYRAALAVLEASLAPDAPDTRPTSPTDLARDEQRYWAGQALLRLATLAGERGQLEAANAGYEKALQACEKSHSADSEAVAYVKLDQAYVHDLNNRLDAALRYIDEALPMMKESDDASRGTAIGMKARILCSKGELAAAEKLLVQAQELMGPPPYDRRTGEARLKSEFGRLHAAQGQRDVAEREFLEALQINREVYTDQHPHVARIMLDLARLYIAEQEYGEAEPLLAHVLATREKFFGKEHIFLAEVLDAQVQVLAATQRDRAAQRARERAAQIRRSAVGRVDEGP